MNPTSKLRFVERVELIEQCPNGLSTGRTVRILQQWWEDKSIALSVYVQDKDGNPLLSPVLGEWRDVPIEKEQT
jgi:hypothetical protein